MKDVSYEILDLLKQYNGDRKQILMENRKPEYLYALSDLRENLLEWFEFDREASLLQVGSDYGALTGLLKSRVKRVTVLDDRDENLAVNKARHGQDGCVEYVKGGLSTYETDQKFDYVVMAGCMEAGDASMVEKARKLLDKNGILIAAVHNQFGLRTWAGAVKSQEEPYVSLHQVRQLYPSGRLYFPVPDYRLPVTLYSEGYLPKKGELTHISAAYDHERYLFFDEEARFDALCGDGQFENFANSFLIVERNQHNENAVQTKG